MKNILLTYSGITESGFIPGGLWTLSTWYTRAETAKRVMIFYFGNQFGQASAKLLAYGILHMRGVVSHNPSYTTINNRFKAGKPGWFWLFVLMGAFTILGGFVLGFFLPDSFKNPHSTFLPKVQIFTDREIHILNTRVLLDDPMKGKKKKSIGLLAFKKAVSGSDTTTSTSADKYSSQTGVYGAILLSPWPTMVCVPCNQKLYQQLIARVAVQ